MIKFLPSRTISRLTELDYNLLGNICSEIFNKGFNENLSFFIRIHKNKSGEISTIEQDNPRGHLYKIELAIPNKGSKAKNRKVTISTILHELRHAMQFDIFKYNVVARFSSYNAYYNSTEEKDARKLERLTTEIVKIYDNYKKAEEKFKKFKLKELG